MSSTLDRHALHPYSRHNIFGTTHNRSLGFGAHGRETDELHVTGISKRWFGIPGPGDNPGDDVLNKPWPQMSQVAGCDPATAQEYWVRYCFRDQATANRFLGIMVHAIALWAPATYFASALQIQPDLHCNGDYACVCDSANPSDALEIRDGQATGEAPLTYCSLGYRTAANGGNSMVFSALGNGDGSMNPNDIEPFFQAAFIMAHELGHAIGLLHEHQRPDAVSGDWIDYNFFNLEGYQALATNDHLFYDPGLPDTMSRLERMAYVATHKAWAETYLDPALDVMPQTAEAGFTQVSTFPHGDRLDFDSIMIYGSTTFSESADKYTLLKHPSQVAAGASRQIETGGSPLWDKKSISPLDIWRVSELYPSDSQAKQQAANHISHFQSYPPVRATVGNLLATTVSAAKARYA